MTKNKPLAVIIAYTSAMSFINIAVAVYLIVQGRDYFYVNESIIVNLSTYIVILSLLIIITLSFLKQQVRDFIDHFKQKILWIAIGFGGIFGTSAVVGIIYTLIDNTEQAANQETWESIISSGVFGVVSTIVISVLIAPIVEELVFRYAGFGIVKKLGLPEKVYPWVAILATSFFFGIIHVFGDSPVQIIFYAALGIVLGFFYYKSDNIIVPITIHLLWNAFSVITMLFV